MPWYGMHLIDRVRNQAAETERSERSPNPNGLEEPPRSARIAQAAPTCAVVALSGLDAAIIAGAAVGAIFVIGALL